MPIVLQRELVDVYTLLNGSEGNSVLTVLTSIFYSPMEVSMGSYNFDSPTFCHGIFHLNHPLFLGSNQLKPWTTHVETAVFLTILIHSRGSSSGGYI